MPRAHTSNVRNVQVHSAATIAGIKSLLYRNVVRFTSAGTPSSSPHVSSNNITCLSLTDQMTMSGRSRDIVIYGGKMIGSSSKSTNDRQSSLFASDELRRLFLRDVADAPDRINEVYSEGRCIYKGFVLWNCICACEYGCNVNNT